MDAWTNQPRNKERWYSVYLRMLLVFSGLL